MLYCVAKLKRCAPPTQKKDAPKQEKKGCCRTQKYVTENKNKVCHQSQKECCCTDMKISADGLLHTLHTRMKLIKGL